MNREKGKSIYLRILAYTASAFAQFSFPTFPARKGKDKREKYLSRASLTNDKMHAWGWQACLGDYTLFYLAFFSVIASSCPFLFFSYGV